VPVLESALAALVAALEALAASVIIGSSIPVEAPIAQSPLLAALHPASFVADRRIALGGCISTDTQTEQTDGQALQGVAPRGGVAKISGQGIELPTVH